MLDKHTLKFFVSSNLSHCSAAESKKFPLQPIDGYVKQISGPKKYVERTFAFPMCHRLPGGSTGGKEEEVDMRIYLRDNRMCN